MGSGEQRHIRKVEHVLDSLLGFPLAGFANGIRLEDRITHRVAFKEVSGYRVHFKSGPGNRGRSACGTYQKQ